MGKCCACDRPKETLIAVLPKDAPAFGAFWICWNCLKAAAETWFDIKEAYPHVD